VDNLVSIVIPCYQQGIFLGDAVSSLQAQTHCNWEALIVNDGSTDETEEIALRICAADQRVRYIAKQNGGLSSARNAGIQTSRGDFIQFLDADDRIAPRKLELQIECLVAHRNFGIVYGNAWYFQDGNCGCFERGPYAERAADDWIERAANDPCPLVKKLLERNIIPVCSPLVRREAVTTVGLFNERLHALEDWEYWFRCAIADVGFLFSAQEGTECYIRMHSRSMTQRSDYSDRGARARVMMYATFFRYLPRGFYRRIALHRLLVATGRLDVRERIYWIRLICGVGLAWWACLLLWVANPFLRGGAMYPVARYCKSHVLSRSRSRKVVAGGEWEERR
jgi:glycosyltransferase involved in cell wall biosynthesis